MSAITASGSATTAPRELWPSFVSAEWIKLRTVRSTMVTLAVAGIFAVGFGALACERFSAHLSGLSTAAQRAHFLFKFDPTSQSLIGNAIAQLAIGTLGVLIVTSEFGTGMIRASLIAMPQRQWWIGAKLAVFTVVALVVGQVLTFTSFWVGQAMLAGQHVGASITDPGVLGTVVATGLYVSLIGVIGACLGLIIKHTAGALTTLLGLLFVLPVLIGVLSEPLQWHVARFLPENIGERAATVTQINERFPVWGGIGLMAGYAAALYLIGAVLLQRRDA